MACDRVDLNNDDGKCAAVEVGYDYLLNVTYKDSAGAVISLVGATIQMIIEDGQGSPLLTLDHVVDRLLTGIYINDAANGDFDVQISDTDSTTVGEGSFPYRVTIIDSVGLKHRISRGVITFIDGDE